MNALRCLIGVCLLGMLPASLAAADPPKAKEAEAAVPDRATLEKRFSELLSNATMLGTYTTDGVDMDPEAVSAIRRMMTDHGTVQARWSALGSAAGRLLKRLLREPGYRRSLRDLQQHAGGSELRVESEVSELERLGFIHRLKGLGLCLAEIRELNAVHALGGSTAAMLARLRDLLELHVKDLDQRIEELESLRGELVRYRDHIEARVSAAGAPSTAARAGSRRDAAKGRKRR